MSLDEGPIRWSGGKERPSREERARLRMERDLRRAEENPHLRDHLAESERIRVCTRQHPIVLVKPVLAAALTGALLLRSLGDATMVDSTRRFFLVLFFVALGWAGVRWLTWSRNFFLATDQRVLKMYGVLSTTVDSMKVLKVTDMKYHRSFLGEILGYGRITIESAGQDQALHDIEYLPYPRENYQGLAHLILGEAPRTGGRKHNRFRRRLEAMVRRGHRDEDDLMSYEVSYPAESHPEEGWPDGMSPATSEASPRVLYSSSDGRRSPTSPIPIYPPGYFADRDPDDSDDDYFGAPTRN